MPQDPIYEEYFDRHKTTFNRVFGEDEQPQQAASEQKTLDQYAVPLNRQQEADWQQTRQEADALLAHQRHTVLGTQKRDSAEMQSVKGSLMELTASWEKTVDLNPASFDQQLTTLNLQYTQMIHSCADYIRAKGSPFTQDGKTRLAMVKTLYNRARREQAALDKTARDFYAQLSSIHRTPGGQDGNPPAKWYHMLQMLRTAALDAGGMEVTYAAHNIAGDTLRIDSRGETVYFLPEASGASLYHKNLLSKFRRHHAHDKSMEAMLDVIKNIPGNILEHMLPPASRVLLDMKNTREGRAALFRHPDIQYVLDHDQLPEEEHYAFFTRLNQQECIDALIRMAKELHEHAVIRSRSQDGNADLLHDRSMTAVAASRLSTLCDMQDAYAQARLVDLKRGEQTVRGTLLRMPEGQNCENFAVLFEQSRSSGGPTLSYSAHALSQLSTIQVIDLLLGIPTRAMEDYQVQYEMRDNNVCHIVSVVAVQHRASGVLPPTDKPLDGLGEPDVVLPDTMLHKVASMIEQLNDNTLNYLLGDLFSDLQLFWVRTRLQRMQEILKYQGDQIKRVDLEQWEAQLKE